MTSSNYQFKSEKSKFSNTGIVEIIQEIRIRLGLSHDEYVACWAIYNARKNKTKIDAGYLFQQTGFSTKEFQNVINPLVEKTILFYDNRNKIQTSEKWNDQFFQEDDFLEFMKIFKNKGSKAKSREFYIKARTTVSKQLLHQRAKEYIETKTDPQFIMYSERYLNPKNAYWETDFKAAQEQHLEKKNVYRAKQ